MPYPPSQLAVEVCLCPERHLCYVKLSVSYPLDITTIYVYSLLFCQYTQDSCKDETDFQYTDAIRSAYSFRPRAVREDWLRLVDGREKMQSGFSLPIRKRQ